MQEINVVPNLCVGGLEGTVPRRLTWWEHLLQ